MNTINVSINQETIDGIFKRCLFNEYYRVNIFVNSELKKERITSSFKKLQNDENIANIYNSPNEFGIKFKNESKITIYKVFDVAHVCGLKSHEIFIDSDITDNEIEAHIMASQVPYDFGISEDPKFKWIKEIIPNI